MEGGISAPTQSVVNFHIRETMKRNDCEASQWGGRGRLALKPPPGSPAEWQPPRGAGGSLVQKHKRDSDGEASQPLEVLKGAKSSCGKKKGGRRPARCINTKCFLKATSVRRGASSLACDLACRSRGGRRVGRSGRVDGGAQSACSHQIAQAQKAYKSRGKTANISAHRPANLDLDF